MSNYQVQQLMTKLQDRDADFRIMALNDLMSETRRLTAYLDEETEKKLVNEILDRLNDSISEVQNLAVKMLGELIPKLRESRFQTIINKLLEYSSSKQDQLRDIAALAYKTVIAEISPSSQLSMLVCSQLTPRLLTQLGDEKASQELLLSTTELLADVFERFPTTIASLPAVQKQALHTLTGLLQNKRLVIRKRSITALGSLVAASSAEILDELTSKTILPGLRTKNAETLGTAVQLVGAMARQAPNKAGKDLADIVPGVLKAAEVDDDDLRESSLTTLETLLYRTPAPITPFLTSITTIASKLIKHDPNYAGDDEMDLDDEEADDEEEEEDNEFGDDLSDDDDVSWKVRRSSAKVLAAEIATRPELLTTFWTNVSPILISRFTEREESVKNEIWQTFTLLLTQTEEFALAPQAVEYENVKGKLKRKRRDSAMDLDGGPISLLFSQVPQIAPAIIKQLSAKSVVTRQNGFELLSRLVSVLNGGLDAYVGPLVSKVEAAMSMSDSTISGTATKLKIDVLEFLAFFFSVHDVSAYEGELNRLVPLTVAALSDRFQKIAAQASLVASSLVKAFRPLPPTVLVLSPLPTDVIDHIRSLHAATLKLLAKTDVDLEVKETAITTLGDIVTHAADELGAESTQSLDTLRDRLSNETTRLATLRTIPKIVSSPACYSQDITNWARSNLDEVASLLRKASRPLRSAAFICLDALLKRSGSSVTQENSKAILSDLGPLLQHPDPYFLPLAVNILTSLVKANPIARPAVEASELPKVFALLSRPDPIDELSLSAITSFLGHLASAGADAMSMVQGLSSIPNQRSARCIGAVVRNSPQSAPATISAFEKSLSATTPTRQRTFALLALGEIGMSIDFSAHQSVLAHALEAFDDQSVEVKNAAAFSVGNIAAGNPSQFFPILVQQLQSVGSKSDIPLRAIKEAVTNGSPEDLAKSSSLLWGPLFDYCENQDEKDRSPVAAECLGRLTLTDPAKYLPQLQGRLSASEASIRATVLTAIRFTFADGSSAYNELLSPLIVQFLSLSEDQDLNVRRLALSSLNSAARHKPAIVRDHLGQLLARVYEATKVDAKLIRWVTMGPFKHKVDDGLQVRQAAYECLLTIAETHLDKINVFDYLDRLVPALEDAEEENEIKVVCYLTLKKLAASRPGPVAQRLDSFVKGFRDLFNKKHKETATSTEVARTEEIQKTALNCLAALSKISSPTASPAFAVLVHELERSSIFGKELTGLQKQDITSNGMDLD